MPGSVGMVRASFLASLKAWEVVVGGGRGREKERT